MSELWIDGLVVLVAVLALPFYLGYIHAPLVHLLSYAAVAGTALAGGERLLDSVYRDDDIVEFAFNAALRAAAVLIWGGGAFLLALWLV